MLIGMGEVFVLLLGEIDLSLGFVAGIGATVATVLVQPGIGWPWWAAIGGARLGTAALGAFQGTLITRHAACPPSWSRWPGCSASRAS